MLKRELKKLIVKNKKNYYELAEFCVIESNREFCNSERTFICKLAIEKIGYKVDKDYDYCKIFKELSKFSKDLKLTSNSNEYLNVTYKPLAKKIAQNGSTELISFLLHNGYVVDN